METKFYYIYKITNLLNGKTYIGKHSTYDLNDGYMGSGKMISASINKYGIDIFEKEILEFTSEDEINEREIFYISHYKSIGKAEYNIAKGGQGGSTAYMSDEDKRKRTEKIQNSWKSKSEEELNDIIQRRANTFKANYANKPEELKEEKTRKWRNSWDKRTVEDRFETSAKQSNFRKAFENNMSQEDKVRRSKAHKDAWANKTAEEKLEFSNIRSKVTKGSRWWTNGTENKFCKECPLGYRPGRIVRNNSNKQRSESAKRKRAKESEEMKEERNRKMKETLREISELYKRMKKEGTWTSSYKNFRICYKMAKNNKWPIVGNKNI